MENIEAYRCPTCSRVYSEKTKISFESHVKKCGSKSFRCDECEKDFITLATLRNHLKNYHTQCSNFVCQTCGKEFKSKFTLNLHEQIHGDATERGRFSCDSCDKTFAWKSSLRRHLHDHFSSDTKAYICPCGQGFQKYAAMYQHKRACQKKGKKVSGKPKKTVPVKRENEEYEHTCQFCGAGFHDRQQLSQHVDTCDPFVKIGTNGRIIPTETQVNTAMETMAQMLAKYKRRPSKAGNPKVNKIKKTVAQDKWTSDDASPDTELSESDETQPYTAKENVAQMLAKRKSRPEREGKGKLNKTENIVAQDNKGTGDDAIPDTELPESIENKQNHKDKEVKELEENRESVSIEQTNQVPEIREIKREKRDDESLYVRGKRKRKPKQFTDYETDFSAPKIKKELEETDVEDRTRQKDSKHVGQKNVGKSVRGGEVGKHISTSRTTRPSQKSHTSAVGIKTLKSPSSKGGVKTTSNKEPALTNSKSPNGPEANKSVVHKQSKEELGADKNTETQTGNDVEVDKIDSGSENINISNQKSLPKEGTVFQMKEFLRKRISSIVDENSTIVNRENEVCDSDKRRSENKVHDSNKKPVKSALTETKLVTYRCTTDSCKKTFRHKKHLKTHKKEAHNETLKYICTDCLKTFTSLYCLKSHYRMCHLHLYSVILAYVNTEFKVTGDMDKNYAVCMCTRCGMELDNDDKDHVCEKAIPLTFYCPYCDVRLPSYCRIQQHYREAHPDKEHSVTLSTKYDGLRGKKIDDSLLYMEETSTKCEICDQVFESNDLLMTHINNTHVSLPYCCGVCLQSYGRKMSIQSHLIQHSSKEFVCKICSKGYYFKKELEAHQRIHSGERPFKCDICGNRYCDEKTVKSHMQKVHVQAFAEKYKDTKAAQRLASASQGCICHICGEVFSIPYQLEQHMESHTKTKIIHCLVCFKEFQTKYQYKLHKKFAHRTCAPKLFKNNIRSQIVSVSDAADVKKTLLELKNVDETHPSGKPVQCAVCHKRFKKVKFLNQHIQSMHLDDRIKNHVCNICERGFPRKSLLNAHLRIHTNSRPYKCRLCPKTYRQLAHVREHLRAHGKSLVACSLCPASFKTNSTLSNHIMTHCTITPFTCPVQACTEKFKDISTLIQHGITCFATNVPAIPFVCKICFQTFDQSSEVILHLYVHENEGLYPCETCGMKHNSFKNLYFHKIQCNHFTEAEMVASKLNVRNYGNVARTCVPQVDWQFGVEDLMNQYDFSEPSIDSGKDTLAIESEKNTLARYKDSHVIEEAYGNEAEELILIAEQLTYMATGAEQYTEAVIADQIGGEQQYDHHLDSDSEQQSALTLTTNNATDNLGYATIVVKNDPYEAESSELFTGETESRTTEKDTYEHVKNGGTMPTVGAGEVVENTRIDGGSVDASGTAQPASITDHVYITDSFVNTGDQTIDVQQTTHHANTVNDNTSAGSELTEIVQPIQIQNSAGNEINSSSFQEESERASKVIESETNGEGESVHDVESITKNVSTKDCQVDIAQDKNNEIESILEGLNMNNIDLDGRGSTNVKIVDTQGNEVTVCVINEIGEQVQITDRQEVLKSILQTGKYELQYNFRQIERAGEVEKDITSLIQGNKEGLDSAIDTSNVKFTDVYVVSEMDDGVPTAKIEPKKQKQAANSQKADKRVLTNTNKIKGELVKNHTDALDVVVQDDYNFKVDLRYYEERDAIRYPFQCQQCLMRFRRVKDLNHHAKNHLPNNKRKFQCSVCDAGFNVPNQLKVHMRIHTGEKPFSCKKCGKSYRQRGHLQVHLRVHENYFPFKCTVCDRQFTSNSNLTMHMRTRHELVPDAKVYSCELCDATFHQPHQIRLHKLTKHLGKTSQKSLYEVCNALESTSGDLEEKKPSKQRTSSEPEKASLICDICGYVSSNSHIAKMHRIRHDKDKPIKCTECDRTYSSELLMKEHKRQTHRDYIPCEICGLMFNNKTVLNTHLLRMHGKGVGKFKCQRCDQMFNSKHSFLKHVSGCMKNEIEKMLTVSPTPEPI